MSADIMQRSGGVNSGFMKKDQDELRIMFELFDSDQNGTIDREELRKVFKANGYYLMNSEVDEIMKEVDHNGDGKIDIRDFTEFVDHKINPSRILEEQLKVAFDVFDRDGDGYISKEDLGQVMRTMMSSPSEDDLNTMLEEADTDGDGQIDFEEFVAVFSGEVGIGAANKTQESKPGSKTSNSVAPMQQRQVTTTNPNKPKEGVEWFESLFDSMTRCFSTKGYKPSKNDGKSKISPDPNGNYEKSRYHQNTKL